VLYVGLKGICRNRNIFFSEVKTTTVVMTLKLYTGTISKFGH